MSHIDGARAQLHHPPPCRINENDRRLTLHARRQGQDETAVDDRTTLPGARYEQRAAFLGPGALVVVPDAVGRPRIVEVVRGRGYARDRQPGRPFWHWFPDRINSPVHAAREPGVTTADARPAFERQFLPPTGTKVGAEPDSASARVQPDIADETG